MAVKKNADRGTALIYCRVAAEGQGTGADPLLCQVDSCVRYAESVGYKVARITREVHSGNDLEGRPLLTRDRIDLRAGRFQAVIAYSPDRVSRRPGHLATLADECGQVGANLLFVTAPYHHCLAESLS